MDQPSDNLQNPKSVMLLTAGMFAMLPLMLLFLTFQMSAARREPFAAEALGYGLGALALIGSALIALTHLQPKGEVGDGRVWPTPAQFQTKMLIALAVAELGALIGFVWFMNQPMKFLPLALGSVLVDTIFVIPRVLAFWRDASEETADAGQPVTSTRD